MSTILDMSNTDAGIASASGKQAKGTHSHGGVGHHIPQDVLGMFLSCATGSCRFHQVSQ